MSCPKTILFLIPHLGGGGAERVTANLVHGLAQDRFRVHLGLITQETIASQDLPKWVMAHPLGANRVRAAAWPLLRLVWKIRPELIFSNMFHLNFLVLLLRPFFPRQTRCVIRQNGMTAPETGTGQFVRKLYRVLYPRAESVVCQSEAMVREMSALTGTARNLRVLPNPVLTCPATFSAGGNGPWRGEGPRLLAVGRLAREKGFDILLPAFAHVLVEFPAAELAILGQGPEEACLKALSRALGIESHVRFAGYVDRPQEWYAGASVFALSSRHEGLSNAMLEAGVAGLPIVAAPALGGVTELIRGVSGDAAGTWLASEVSADALADSLITALKSLGPGQRFIHSWVDAYRMENALPQFVKLIDEVLAGAPA